MKGDPQHSELPDVLIVSMDVDQSVVDLLTSELAGLGLRATSFRADSAGDDYLEALGHLAGCRNFVFIGSRKAQPVLGTRLAVGRSGIEERVFAVVGPPKMIAHAVVMRADEVSDDEEELFPFVAYPLVESADFQERLRDFALQVSQWIEKARGSRDVIVEAKAMAGPAIGLGIALTVGSIIGAAVGGAHGITSILTRLMRKRSRPPAKGRRPDGDELTCSLYAPPHVRTGEAALVQVFAHLGAAAGEAASLARLFDAGTALRASKSLDEEVRRGTRLGFHLSVPGAAVDSPDQQLTWRGETASVQFGVTFPKGARMGGVVGSAVVTRDGVPVGHLKFKLSVVPAGESTPATGVGAPRREAGEWRPYRQAFISYASCDRAEVLKRVQMISAAGLGFFQDVLSLDPGARWEKMIYRHIDSCDVFFLFWSKAAKESEWVRKETLYAYGLKGGDDECPPEIIPILIEGPPPVAPPEELSFLHFNDRFIYLIAASRN